MATQIGDVAKRNAQNNRQKITARISSPLADSGTSHTTKKAAENVPRRGYNFYIQLEATPGIVPPIEILERSSAVVCQRKSPIEMLKVGVEATFLSAILLALAR
jgi:hypothetical protein